MKKTHLLLVDDQLLFIESLRRVIENIAPDIVVDSIANNGETAIAAANRYRSDVVLMDVRMPTMDGVEATKSIRSKLPGTQVIILTTYDDDEYLRRALDAGAVGYLLKDIPLQELVSAVRAVSKGAFIISPSIAKRLVMKARESRPSVADPVRQADVPLWLSYLSRREREVLCFVANGLSNREIADTLFIAEQTVKNHVSTIYSKIGENDRFRVIEKIKECLEKGYLMPPRQDGSDH